ncbi:MAG: response regulator transcription factor [Pedobacter sp.]|nr:MAG: response regulator transcription factor [Pedobacter sp.]
MEIQDTKIKIAFSDDHILVRNAIGALINSFEDYLIINLSSNGRELIEFFKLGNLPQIVLLDLNMPEMNGHETATWLKENHPDIHVLLLTKYDSELTLIRLLQQGVKGFLRKDCHPDELRFALQSVVKTGYYYSNHTTGRIINLFRNGQTNSLSLQKALLSDQELQFLQLACSDRTYKEVACEMNLNVRTIDTLRDQLFMKLDVKSRVGLVMVAIKHGIHTW